MVLLAPPSFCPAPLLLPLHAPARPSWRAARTALTEAARALRPWAELRIDVQAPLVDGELEAIHERLHTLGSHLHGCASLPMHRPGLRLRWREADGAWYAYVEDVQRGCLAGYTVFQRLVEVDRRTDRHVRSPHSRYAPAYQRQGIASAVYRRALDAGMNLLSGARQSPAAHGLWQHLARHHGHAYVSVEAKPLAWLGPQPPAAVLDRLGSRRLLLGRGWSLARLAAELRMQGLPDSDDS